MLLCNAMPALGQNPTVTSDHQYSQYFHSETEMVEVVNTAVVVVVVETVASAAVATAVVLGNVTMMAGQRHLTSVPVPAAEAGRCHRSVALDRRPKLPRN